MRKLTKKLVSLVLLVILSLTCFACGDKNEDGNEQATLYIWSFTSGFGKEWLDSLIADYESANSNVEIPGFAKKGIKIKPTALKQDVSGSNMAGMKEVLFFLEQKDYYELLDKNHIADITDAITGKNPYDGKTLESKMFADQKSYLGREINGETHYYAYPHYFTGFGITYDVELFDRKGYYFVKDYQTTAKGKLADMFLGSEGVANGWAKTDGPDQTPNTSDDGLPTTYEEFLLLCDYIATIGNDNPLVWAGQYRDSYLTHFINALATDYEGYDQMRLNYTFKGEATSLGKIVSGKFVQDATSTVIDGTNGAELARQAGKYYAMDFYSDIYAKSYVKNDKNDLTLFSSNYSHLTAHQDFLIKSTVRNAMLLDGSWWYAEAVANESFKNSGSDSQSRKLGWMPLPKQSEEKVGETRAMFDLMYPLCFIKNGLAKDSWQYKYAVDFLQFANSDAQLAKFTKITGCTKALNYDLTSAQYNDLSYYAKTFYDAYKSADKVFPYANNVVFAGNQSTFNEITGAEGSPFYQSATFPKKTFISAIEDTKKPATAETYFAGMYEYFNSLDIWKKV